jgi:succinate-acetate transporter protein
MPGRAAARQAPRPDPEGHLMPEQMTRIVLRPLASSLPLGFFAFGMGTILLTAAELHWAPPAQTRLLMIMVLAFVAPLELIAGLLALATARRSAASRQARRQTASSAAPAPFPRAAGW